jgi:hypothetical protein
VTVGTVAPGRRQDHYCFIIHDAIPYCYDLNTVLALPSGFRYRNRFDTPWVEPNLRDEIHTMVGQRVLLILRDQSRNKLIPARWARIKRADRIGRIFYFEYILEHLIQYPERTDLRDAKIEEFTARFAEYHAWLPGTPGEALGAQNPSVFRSVAGAGIPTVADDVLSDWGNTVSAVTTSATFRQVEFLKVLGLFDLQGRAAPVVDESFVVKPNTVYQLRVFQTIPAFDPASDLTPHDIDVRTFSDHFVLLRPKQRAVGKYDMLNFVLKTRSISPRERSAIEIPHSPHHGQGIYAPNALYMPVVTEGRSALAVASYLGAALVAVLLMFKPDLVPADGATIRNVATIFFVLLVSGWANTAHALFPHLPWTAGGKE